MPVKSVDTKKNALIYIKIILEKYSDSEHLLTQQDILSYLEKDYGIFIERRTVGRDIELLRNCGMDIVSNKKGSYLAGRLFKNSELRLLMDAVLCSNFIDKTHAGKLINKLHTLTSDYYRPTEDLYKIIDNCNKMNNFALFENIDKINDAIVNYKMLKFDFYKYGVDKKLYKSKSHKVTPIQTVFHNQRYYLMAINEKYKSVAFFRIDHIKNMSIIKASVATDIKTIKGYEHGVDYNQLSVNPYMYTDKPELITFQADECIMDQLIDWFGDSIKCYRIQKTGVIRCTIQASPKAMEAWAMQYLNYVEIIYPRSLRLQIKDNINRAVDKYIN